MGFWLRDESLIKPRRSLHGYHSPHPPYCGQWLILHHKGGYLSPWPPSFVVLLFGSLEAPAPWNSLREWPTGLPLLMTLLG